MSGVDRRIENEQEGIAEEQQMHIFEPFFTTKPAGLGSGLGLSLSYDIITKGHRGKLEMRTNGEGTEFIVGIPIKQ